MKKYLPSIGLIFLACTALGGPPRNEWLADAPAVAPQADGVLYLNVEAAAIVRHTGNQAKNVNGQSFLGISNGRIQRWAGELDRPCWRANVASTGWYRLVLNAAPAAGRTTLVTVSLWSSGEHRLSAVIDGSGQGNALVSYILGESKLEAGPLTVDYVAHGNHPQQQLELADLRLIPLDELRRLEPAFQRAAAKLGVDKLPELAALEAQVQEIQRPLLELNRLTRLRDFHDFASYAQFSAFDEASARLAALEKKNAAVSKQLHALREAKVRSLLDQPNQFSADEKQQAAAYLQTVQVDQDAEARPYPKTVYPARSAAAGRAALFPTGHLDGLPKQQIDPSLPVVKLNVTPPTDAAERMAHFERRNSPAEIATLCRQFQRVLRPGTPGLEAFERLFAQGQYAAALAAYRAYFFDKLAQPAKYGAAVENILFDLTRDRGKGHLLFSPLPFALEKNLQGVAVAQFNNELLLAEVGPPGAVPWAPAELRLPEGVQFGRGPDDSPFWRTPAGKDLSRKITFFRFIDTLPSDRSEYFGEGLFNALLFSYAATGNREHLSRWCQYVDDWAMNRHRDLENCPVNLRAATELATQQVRATLTFLRILLDERPAVIEDFDAATLARFLMVLVQEYAPYTTRAKRAEIANWGMMGVCHQLNVGNFLHEFKAMEYFHREAWRLSCINLVQQRTLDGENCEAWDDGHNNVDTEFALESVPFVRLPAGVDELDRTLLWETLKIGQRNKLTHISPAGQYWPSWTARLDRTQSLAGRYLQVDAAGRMPIDLIFAEPGVQQRIETLLDSGRPLRGSLPAATSDLAPYAAMAYLRESWQPDADYLIFENFRERSQSLSDCPRTMYMLNRGGLVLVEGNSLAVDRRPDNRYYGKIRTGGKTDFCAMAGRNVEPCRFHTSPRFDFVEGRQDSPYARPTFRTPEGLYGLYRQPAAGEKDPPITDVTALRQVFQVRGERLWIVADRIESRSSTPHEYTQFFTLPVRLPNEGLADRVRLLSAAGLEPIEENRAEGCFRTFNPGFDNVSIYCFAPTPLQMANVLNRALQHESLAKKPLAVLRDALAAKQSPEQVMKRNAQRPVSVRWSGAGNQAFVNLLCSRPAASDLNHMRDGDLANVERIAGDGGTMGIVATTATGATVRFFTGPEQSNRLQCGEVVAQAESLLLVSRTGEEKSAGLILGCRSLSIHGAAMQIPGPDFEFTLDRKPPRLAAATLIHRSIDTVRISPPQNVFTDTLDVSFDIPTQDTSDVEFRYTLDGAEPTLQSPLYSKPITLAESTLVKVRPFRKGLRETPWHFTGTDCGRTIAAIFRKQPMRPALPAAATAAGLRYEYLEGEWPALFAYAGCPGVLDAKASGVVSGLLDPGEVAKIRATDRAFAIRYRGYVQIPQTGVYGFYAPVHLYTPTMDAGYDLRVFIDGEEWLPTPGLHAENIWFVPLEAGLHRLAVSYVDYRGKAFRDEYWMSWQAEEMWQGVPVLEISGPGLTRQPLPAALLRRPK